LISLGEPTRILPPKLVAGLSKKTQDEYMLIARPGGNRRAEGGAARKGNRAMPTINTDKVCFVVVKARELESEDEGVDSDASNATDDGFVSVLTEDAFNAVRAEVASFIDAMDVDEQAELVALTWVGRGEFAAEEWGEALRQARERREGSTSNYLLGIPLLASLLENGLGDFGESCTFYASDRQ
jgi:hypothetical protein